MKKSESKNTSRRGWPSCLVDTNKLDELLTGKSRTKRWLWTGDGPGRIDAKTGRRVEQKKPISIRTIFKIATRLECDPGQLVSESDAQIIYETARGKLDITNLGGIWGGDPCGEYMLGAYGSEYNFSYLEGHFGTIDHQDYLSHECFIPVDYFDPEERVEVLALEHVSNTTIATKSSSYELTSLLARRAKVPQCNPDIQRISVNTEPLVLVHDVDAHKEVTRRLVDLFDRIQQIVGEQRTLPVVSELEGHEACRSEIKDHLNWFAMRNIQVLDTSIHTDFVLLLDSGREVFASFARPLLILAPTSLVDIKVKYSSFKLRFGLPF